MKKVISVKEIMIILVSVMLIMFSTSASALDFNLGNNNTPTTIPSDEYKNAQTPDVDNKISGNNTTGNNTAGNNTTGNNTAGNNAMGNNATGNNATGNNTNTNTTDLPQTGIEDYNIGILLIICIASAIFAYRKISDYRNI